MNKTRIVLFLFLGLTGLCILGSFFGDPVPDETTQETTGEPRKPVKEDGQSVTSAPFKDSERTNTDDELLSYIDRKILADKVRGEKISYDVVLKRKPSANDLLSLAKLIIAEHEGEFKRVFIVYYLPGMTIDEGGWAISHKRDVDSEIEFRILGQSKEAELNLQSTVIPRDWNVFGRWIDRYKDSGLLTVYRQDGQMMLQVIYNDNSVGYHKIKPIKVGEISGYEEIGSKFDDGPPRWLITSNGSLQIMDYGTAFGEKYGDPLPKFFPRELVRYRIWQDSTGTFQVNAELKLQNMQEVTLIREGNGEEIVVAIDDLSAIDQQWLRSERIRKTVEFKIDPE